MPHVQIKMLKGRTVEQKRKLAPASPMPWLRIAERSEGAISAAIVEVTKEDFAMGGTLVSDRK